MRQSELFCKLYDRMFEALQSIYDFYDEFARKFPVACRAGCAACCSVNVTLTSLEMEYLRSHELFSSKEIMSRLVLASEQNHFIPSLTTNTIAAYCLNHQEPPLEHGEHAPGTCPLLAGNKHCLVYEQRPFACRAMLSRHTCKTGGAADMSSFFLTVNLSICQMIEHLDQNGVSGNLLDMLAGKTLPMVKNHSLPGFLVPPEQKKAFRRFIDDLFCRRAGGNLLQDYFNFRIP